MKVEVKILTIENQKLSEVIDRFKSKEEKLAQTKNN